MSLVVDVEDQADRYAGEQIWIVDPVFPEAVEPFAERGGLSVVGLVVGATIGPATGDRSGRNRVEGELEVDRKN